MWGPFSLGGANVAGALPLPGPHLGRARKEAKGLVDQFKSFRISWVPRELNVEADRLVNDALGAPHGSPA